MKNLDSKMQPVQISEANAEPELRGIAPEILSCLNQIRRGVLRINGYNTGNNSSAELEAYYIYCRELTIGPRCQSQFSRSRYGGLSCSCAGYEGP